MLRKYNVCFNYYSATKVQTNILITTILAIYQMHCDVFSYLYNVC